jgi:hypothetical protein
MKNNIDQIEFLYELNLPTLEDILVSADALLGYTENLYKGSKIFYPNVKELFKKEWLGYKGLHWDYCSLFIRSGKEQSIIHRDNPQSPTTLHWGINWIIGNHGYMDYWDSSQIEDENLVIDGGGQKTVKLKINQPPNKIYLTRTGAYLVNASAPHRIRNESDNLRIAVSLRSKKFRNENPNLQWSDIVNIFKDIIL